MVKVSGPIKIVTGVVLKKILVNNHKKNKLNVNALNK
jgi:hypothetical protein